MYITHFWGSVDWARVATRYAEVSKVVVPDALPSFERWGGGCTGVGTDIFTNHSRANASLFFSSKLANRCFLRTLFRRGGTFRCPPKICEGGGFLQYLLPSAPWRPQAAGKNAAGHSISCILWHRYRCRGDCKDLRQSVQGRFGRSALYREVLSPPRQVTNAVAFVGGLAFTLIHHSPSQLQ